MRYTPILMCTDWHIEGGIEVLFTATTIYGVVYTFYSIQSDIAIRSFVHRMIHILVIKSYSCIVIQSRIDILLYISKAAFKLYVGT